MIIDYSVALDVGRNFDAKIVRDIDSRVDNDVDSGV